MMVVSRTFKKNSLPSFPISGKVFTIVLLDLIVNAANGDDILAMARKKVAEMEFRMLYNAVNGDDELLKTLGNVSDALQRPRFASFVCEITGAKRFHHRTIVTDPFIVKFPSGDNITSVSGPKFISCKSLDGKTLYDIAPSDIVEKVFVMKKKKLALKIGGYDFNDYDLMDVKLLARNSVESKTLRTLYSFTGDRLPDIPDLQQLDMDLQSKIEAAQEELILKDRNTEP